jgi:hypothetical protein
VAILVALVLPALIGLAALAIDMGYVLVRKNHMQVAADAAALVGANARQHGEDLATAQALAHAGAAANGFTDTHSGITVEVLIPPGGTQTYANDDGYVRVTITQPTSTFLAGIFGVTSTVTSATALAGPAGSGVPCMLTLGSTGAAALRINGNAQVTANDCSIAVNSDNATALQLKGNVQVSAQSIHVVGGASQTGNVQVSDITTNAPPATDPFANLATPSFNGCDFTNYKTSGNGSLTLTPGTYCGGIRINGNHTLHFNPGLYVLYGGGIKLAGNISPITGSNITVYNSGNASSYPYAELDLTGNLTLELSAPTSGPYAGMLFMQDPLNTQDAAISTNSDAVLAGNFYFPSNTLSISGNTSAAVPVGAIVAKRILISGNSKISLSSMYGNIGVDTQRPGLYE